MRIVSLLPSATEIVCALGMEDDLVGVSQDCDHPPEAVAGKPVVSRSSLTPVGDAAADIDAAVRDSMESQQPIYRLERELVRELRPELILAQDLCRVCAVPSGHVTEALEGLGCSDARVVSLDPMSLGDVLDQIVRVGEAGGRPVAAREVVSGLGRRLDSVAGAVDGLPVVPMLGLEWPDPPFTAGHWVPEMIKRAGGRDVIGVERAPSRRATWDEIAASSPEVVVNMPCGYGLDEAVELARDLYDREGLAGTPALRSEQVYAVDASGYFSRPGPRLVDGVEILASILHPDSVPLPPPGRAARVPRPA